MATFFIKSSNETTFGTPQADQFFIESGVNRIDLQGLAGADEFRYFFGGVNSSYNFGNSNVNANGGDDTIRIKLQTGADILANAFRGGLDNDNIVLTAVSGVSGSTFAGNLLQGGLGNDTIKVKVASAAYNNLTLNGNEGADFLSFSASADVTNRVNNINLFGGQGSDQVQVDINGSGAVDISVAGGLGSDRVQLNFEDAVKNLIVNGGTFGTEGGTDEGDDIYVSAEDFEGNNSIIGNAGNDTIRVVADTANNMLIAGNAGNDTLIFSADEGKNITVGGGNGSDLIEIRNAGTANGHIFSAGRNSLIGGNGDDTIFMFSGDGLSAANVTIQGGGGADLFFAAASAGANETALDAISGGNFSYASLTDSTIDTLDTIIVGSAGTANANSGVILNLFMPAAVTVNAFDGQAGGFQFSAGILEMDTAAGSGGNISLSQIVGTLDATLSEGEAVAFRLGTSDTEGFVFVAGADAGVNDDLLVKIEGFNSDSMSAGDASLSDGGANSLILDLA